MNIETRIGTANGIESREQLTPHGWTDVWLYTPHSCLWDYYGSKAQRERMYVLGAAGVECEPLVTSMRRTAPAGTGPGGRVRFGDDMMPGVYRVAVPNLQVTAAIVALDAHDAAIGAWLLDTGSPMPTACYA